MSIFKNVVLCFKGDEFTVKSTEIMRLIGRLEDVISIADLTQQGGPKPSRLAEAYAIALISAGSEATIEEVYESLFDGEYEAAAESVSGLMLLMMPPKTYNPTANGGKKKAAAKKKA